MMLREIEEAARAQFLSINGALHPAPGDVPDGVQTVVLLGPSGPEFWAHFATSTEYQDDRNDPLDRWSKRVIQDIAQPLGAEVFFPSDGPPYPPFIQWALASGRAFLSPNGLLVHEKAGLWVSYRGALGLTERLKLPDAGQNPCVTCVTQPCITACPVDALRPDGYNVAACKTDLESPNNDCMARGCAVRRACPISQKFGRTDAQSAFHMEAFKCAND